MNAKYGKISIGCAVASILLVVMTYSPNFFEITKPLYRIWDGWLCSLLFGWLPLFFVLAGIVLSIVGKKKKETPRIYGRIGFWLNTGWITVLVVLIAISFSAYFEERRINSEAWRTKQAQRYFATREDIDDALRQSILAGKITVGMFPDEAVAAGGPFFYKVESDSSTSFSRADIRLYFDYVKNKPSHPRMPPDILWMQRTEQMEDVEIALTFWNKTQYDTEDFVTIRVRFEAGRVSSIERIESLGDDDNDELD